MNVNLTEKLSKATLKYIEKTAVFIATPMKKHIQQFFLQKGAFFCHFVDRDVVGLMRKYNLLTGDTSQISIFFPYIR